MITPVAILALAFTAQQPSTLNPCAGSYTQNVWDPRFTPGQRWSYHTRPLDKDSTLTITKIDYVPDIGFVVHIMVDHVDFDDKSGDRPRNNVRREYFAIRRDSLDASVLERLDISQVAEPDSVYWRWQTNCAGLTYGTTVADTLKTLQDAYLAQRLTLTMQTTLAPIPSGKPESVRLTLSQLIINEQSPIRELQGQLSFKDGSPVKDARIEITLTEIPTYNPDRKASTSAKTNSDGVFQIPVFAGSYNFNLTLDGFRSKTGTLFVSATHTSLRLQPEPQLLCKCSGK